MYQAILFDVSDTLVDYHPDFARIYGDRLRALGFEVDDTAGRAIKRAVNWEIGQQSLREMKGAPCLSQEQAAWNRNRAALFCLAFPADMEETYLHMMAEMPEEPQTMRVIPGVFAVLDALKDKYRLAIVSNHYTWLAERLRELRLYEYFDPVVISEDVGVEKPDVRIMKIALEKLGVSAKACLYVGDHPLDVLCAKRAGMDCAWLQGDWTQMPVSVSERADYKLKDITDLLRILT